MARPNVRTRTYLTHPAPERLCQAVVARAEASRAPPTAGVLSASTFSTFLVPPLRLERDASGAGGVAFGLRTALFPDPVPQRLEVVVLERQRAVVLVQLDGPFKQIQ